MSFSHHAYNIPKSLFHPKLGSYFSSVPACMQQFEDRSLNWPTPDLQDPGMRKVPTNTLASPRGLGGRQGEIRETEAQGVHMARHWEVEGIRTWLTSVPFSACSCSWTWSVALLSWATQALSCSTFKRSLLSDSSSSWTLQDQKQETLRVGSED